MFELIPLNTRERNLFSYFENLERSLFGEGFGSPGRVGAGQFRTDIVDQGDRFVLRAELPGFSKEDIHVDVEQGCVTIQASREEETGDQGRDYVRKERRYGAYSRSFDLTGIDPERIEAAYENGILSLQLPKLEQLPEPPVRRIEIQ